MSSPFPSGFPLDKAELVALSLESVVFGVFLTLFVILIALFHAKGILRLAHPRFIVTIATIMMTFSTTHITISFVRIIKVYTTGNPARQPDPKSNLAKFSEPLRSLKTLVYFLQTLLGDGVLAWRCCIVYNRSFYIIIPAGIALLADVALSIPVCVSLVDTPVGLPYFGDGAWQIGAIASFFFVTVFLHLFCTIAIASKLWRAHRRISRLNHNHSLFPVITVIIESGALYTVGVTSLAITFLAPSYGQQVLLDTVTPLVGVIFCLIILQIRLQTRVVEPSSTGMISRSLQWRVSDRASTHELGDTATVQITQHRDDVNVTQKSNV